jgi:hypothetical protein
MDQDQGGPKTYPQHCFQDDNTTFYSISFGLTDLLATTKTSWGFSTAAMARAARSICKKIKLTKK